MFSGISQHPSEGFPGAQAVPRSYGRPGDPPGGRSARPKVCSNARTGPFWCQKPSWKSVLYPTYFGPHFSTFQPVQSAIWGSDSSYKHRTNRLDKIIYFDHIHPNMPLQSSRSKRASTPLISRSKRASTPLMLCSFLRSTTALECKYAGK